MEMEKEMEKQMEKEENMKEMKKEEEKEMEEQEGLGGEGERADDALLPVVGSCVNPNFPGCLCIHSFSI